MGRFGLNISINPEAIPNCVRKVLEQFREISARVLLNQQCCNEEPDIDQWNALCQILQRVPQRQSEILFLECCPEFPRDRL